MNKQIFSALLLLSLMINNGSFVQAGPALSREYDFASYLVDGTDGISNLYSAYSHEDFQVVAFQVKDDGKANNKVRILGTIRNSAILWSDIFEIETCYERGGTGICTFAIIAPMSPGTMEMLQNYDLTVPDGKQTIILSNALYFTDGSTITLDVELTVDVR